MKKYTGISLTALSILIILCFWMIPKTKASKKIFYTANNSTHRHSAGNRINALNAAVAISEVIDTARKNKKTVTSFDKIERVPASKNESANAETEKSAANKIKKTKKKEEVKVKDVKMKYFGRGKYFEETAIEKPLIENHDSASSEAKIAF